MSLATTVSAMAAAGCSADQIAAVVAAHEVAQGVEMEAKRLARRAGNAERQRRFRNAHNAVTARDSALPPAPLPEKEKSPPTPPSKEKQTLSPPPVGEANASLVDADAVDPPAGAKVVEFDRKKTAKAQALMATGEWWNELAAKLGLPQIDAIKAGSSREKHAWARCQEWLGDHDSVAGMHDLLAARIRGSPLLRGGKGGWAANFDWLMTASNFQKVMDGNYEDRKTGRGV